MWNRLTERTRRAVYHADDEARRYGSSSVFPDHMLLGIIVDPNSVAVRILTGLGLSMDTVRTEIVKDIPKTLVGKQDKMELSPDGRKALDNAYIAARELDNSYIGTEHLLLGLMRVSDGRVNRLLTQLGAGEEAILKAMTALQDEDS